MKGKTQLIHDIARETGVSLATAYRAVTAPNTVADDTRRRVLKMMEERNISIDRRPRSMRRPRTEMRTGRVAFLVPQMSFRTVEMINEEMTHGIQKVFSQRGIELVLHHYAWGAEPTAAVPSVLRDQPVDGILLRPPGNRAMLVEFCRNRKAVLLGNSFQDLDIPSVLVDDEAAIRNILDYLFELGHRRISFVSLTPTMTIYRRRLDSYYANLHRLGLVLDDRLVKLHEGWVTPVEENKVICKQFIDELFALDAPPTAIVCTSDSFATGLMIAAKQRGVRVPEQLSVTGFGDQYFAALSDPPLTTVQVDQRALGEAGALLLLQVLDGASALSQVLIRPNLVERRSCAAVNTAYRGENVTS